MCLYAKAVQLLTGALPHEVMWDYIKSSPAQEPVWLEKSNRFSESKSNNITAYSWARACKKRDITDPDIINKGKELYDGNIHGFFFRYNEEYIPEMVDEISKEFEIDPPAIRFEPLGLDTLGSTSKSARSIAVNNNALRDRKTINEYLNADNALAATDVKGIAAHEMGHVLCKRYSDIGVEIAKETYYNLYKETKSDSGMADWLYENISEYSIYGGELIPEVLSKHKTNPNSFTTEFIKLLKRRWREWTLRK